MVYQRPGMASISDGNSVPQILLQSVVKYKGWMEYIQAESNKPYPSSETGKRAHSQTKTSFFHFHTRARNQSLP